MDLAKPILWLPKPCRTQVELGGSPHREHQVPMRRIGNETLRREHTRQENWALGWQTKAAAAQRNLDWPADRGGRKHRMKGRSIARGFPPAQREMKAGRRGWKTPGFANSGNSALFSCSELSAASPPGFWQHRSGYAEPGPVPPNNLDRGRRL